jgi:hypothetical protein
LKYAKRLRVGGQKAEDGRRNPPPHVGGYEAGNAGTAAGAPLSGRFARRRQKVRTFAYWCAIGFFYFRERERSFEPLILADWGLIRTLDRRKRRRTSATRTKRRTKTRPKRGEKAVLQAIEAYSSLTRKMFFFEKANRSFEPLICADLGQQRRNQGAKTERSPPCGQD